MGRTGKLFAHEWAGIEPDVMSLGQGHRRRLPARRDPGEGAGGQAPVPGTHGSTFGGNPLACAAGNAVLDVILAPGFLDGVDARASTCARGCETWRSATPRWSRTRAAWACCSG